jgi:hypothetical protein
MLQEAYRVLLFSLAFLIVSCTDDIKEGNGPTIRLVNQSGIIHVDTTVSPGEILNFGIDAQMGDFHITQFLINVYTENRVQTWFDSGLYTPNLTWYGSFIKSYNDNETWEFVVRDRYSKEHSISLFISNDTLSGPGEIDIFTNTLLGAQANDNTGGFLDLFHHHNYHLEDAFQNQQWIDIIYYLGEDEHTLGSPGANIEDGVFDPEMAPATWDYRNETRYIPLNLTVDAFNQIENDSILIVSYIEGEGKRKAKNLEPGNVFSFKTQDLRFGMIKINEISGGADGTVSMDIKIQKWEGR